MRSTSRSVLSQVEQPGIVVLTINRPEARNAIDDNVAIALGALLAEFDSSPDLRVCLLTGAGGVFSAGLDLKAFLRGEIGEHPERGFAGLTRRPPRKPVIAAIEGFALAGGLEIALACDLIVAARDARIGIPEVRRGLVADGGALLELPRRLPLNVAMEMALTGRELPAERLHSLGLVNEIAPPGQALDRARELARVVARNAPLGVLASKEVLRSSDSWGEDRWERQREIVRPVWQSEDAGEGATAFSEKREPVFRGR